jgi:phosphatidylethanolamine/phosphatidyl-N-methylethanolamine N-methyltransferase
MSDAGEKRGKESGARRTGANGVKKHRWRDSFLFMGKFLKHGTKIASVWPSSKTLSRATIKQVDWANAKVVVELGAGTGPITEACVAKLRSHTRLIAIERDADFAKILQQRFEDHPNVEIVQGDVRELEKILKARGITQVDAFVSGLPTPSLPLAVRRRMFVAIRRYMAPHGVYSNITEIPYWYLRYYKAFFHQVKFDLVVRNIPPGGVFHCRAMRGA